MISDRLGTLLKQKQKLFHTQDLSVLWPFDRRQTLLQTISRYVRKGILIPIHKGLYSLVPPGELDPYLVGTVSLHSFAYVSTETVLFRYGAIKQAVYPITLVGDQSASFQIGKNSYLVRRMKSKYLNNLRGISSQNGIFVAEPARAAADMLYYRPRYFFDHRKVINWQKVKLIQKEVFYA